MEYTLPRGTQDILPEEIDYWNFVEKTAKSIFALYNFNEIRTPIFESANLFNRVISESDIVKKEMYTFLDKGNRELALRPEGTAPVARAYITNNLHRVNQHQKLFYQGPMFRYERPQAGRYRQFHQIGVESIGSDHPFSDAEVITMSYRLFKALGLKNIKIYINSVGSDTCRPVIEARIKQFLASNLSQLSENLQEKFKNNPLKMLDSKDEKLQTYLAGLPDMREALSQESKDHFNFVISYLDHLNIPFEYKPTLVRGLDYYTETVFEVVSEDLGAQNSICGGGRYNNLIKTLGGKHTPSVGFAFGMERLIMLLKKQNITLPTPPKLVYVAALGKEYQMEAILIAEQLRKTGLLTSMDYTKLDFNAHIKTAQKISASHIIIIGENEYETKTLSVKDLKTRSQVSVPFNDITSYFQSLTETINV